MGVLCRKVWRDLWKNKARTLQVVLIIGMGAFAIGMIIGTRDFIITGMEDIWLQSSPATISLWAYPSVDDDTLVALKRIEGIAEVEGFLKTTLEWRLSPDDRWLPGELTARDDYESQEFAKLSLFSGGWPHRKAFAVGQGCDVTFGIQQGNQVYIRVDDREYLVEVGGVIYDPNIQPPGFGGNAQFYTTRDRFGDLTGERNLNRILAGAVQYDETQATAIADEMQSKLEKIGVESGGIAPPNGDRISAPDRHFFQDTMDGIFFILGLMAVLALILGLFLVYNTIAAIINRQINQIGIMKAVGASTGRVLLVYLINVLIYGLLALVIALPLGVIGARVLGTFLLEAFNAGGSFAISPSAILAQVAIALLSPVLACMIPIFAGARITVREAISTYGLRASSSLLARLLAKAQRIPRLVSLTISNTFRHKQRVLLTQITLVLSGVIFMTVLSAKDATVYTLDDLFLSILRFNINFQLREPERIDRVEALTLSQPGVKAVEMWSLEGATIRPEGQAESNDDEPALLFGVPLPTSLYGPQMRAGRWLQPGDTYAAVLNQKLARDAGVGVGDTVTFDHSIYG